MSNATVPVRCKPSPFPWRCGECGQERVEPAVVPYTAKVKYNGQVHSVDIPGLPVLRCAACGALLFNNESNEEINRAFRDQQGLLQPEAIRQQRLKRGWTQKRLAEELATAEATISRWETGTVIQTQASDKALRRCLGVDCKPSAEPMMGSNDVFSYLAVADRETLLSGLLAWLLDPQGSHGLERSFLEQVWRCVHPEEELPEDTSIKVEDRRERDKRFDISILNSSGRHLLVLEVKCKTQGTAAQLEEYAAAGKGIRVARVGFAEWNWALQPEQQRRFPLITFSQVASMMKQVLCGPAHETPYRAFIAAIAAHLEEEAGFFSKLKDFFFGAGSDRLPLPPPSLRHSWRFYSGLYWEWFQRRLQEKGRFQSVQWKPPKSEPSGVWFATQEERVTDALTDWVHQLIAVPSGPVNWWVHIELTERSRTDGTEGGIVARSDTDPAGRIQLGVKASPEIMGRIYEAVKGCSTLHAFSPPGRKPRGGTCKILTRELQVKDFRYDNLTRVLAQLLKVQADGAAAPGDAEERRPGGDR